MAPAPCPEVGKVEIFLIGGRADGSGPRVPLRGFLQPRPRSGQSGTGNLAIQCLYSDDFFAKFAVFFGIVRITHNRINIGD